MDHHIPHWVYELLYDKFTEREINIIDREWYKYIDTEFNRTLNSELIRNANLVLNLHALKRLKALQ